MNNYKKERLEEKSKVSALLVIICIFILVGLVATFFGKHFINATGFQVAGSSEADAIPLQFGSPVSSEIPAGQSIYYKFTGTIGKNYNIDFTGKTAYVSGCGSTIVSSVAMGDILANYNILYPAFSSSPCLIKVDATFSPAAFSYTVKVSESEMPTIQGTLSDVLPAYNEIRGYKFYADTSKKYWVSVGGQIPTAKLLGPSGEQIGSLPQVFVPTTSGNHYVAVYDMLNFGGSFSITIKEEAASTKKKLGDACTANDECESNYCDAFLKSCFSSSTVKYPGRLTVGSVASGSLNAGEIAYHEFYPTANQQYILTYKISSGSGEFWILDKNKNVVISGIGFSSGQDFNEQFKPTISDLYYIAVVPRSGSAISYSILPSAQEGITAISVSNAAFLNTDTIAKKTDFSVKVNNLGTRGVDVSIVLTMTSTKGTSKSSGSISLKTGESKTYTFYQQPIYEGNNKFAVDVEANAPETNKLDNHAEETYSVIATSPTQPDFIISDFSSSIPLTQDSVTLFATIKNIENIDVNNLRVDFFYIKGDASCCISNVAPTQYISIKAGESKTVSAWMTTPAGYYKFKVWLDKGNAILESNENNNFAERYDNIKAICGNNICDSGETYQTCSYDCRCGNTVCDSGETYENCPSDCKQALPDLAVIDFYTSNANPIEDDLLTIYATVKNYGDASANNFGIYFTYKQDDGLTNEIDTKYITLNAGGSETVSSSLWVVKGTYVLSVFVDSGKTLTESNENNNLAQKTILVAQKQVQKEEEVCGNGYCVLPENCETCPQDCLTEGIEVCCDNIRVMGNCCTDNNCESGAKCVNNVCSMYCNNNGVCDASEKPEDCGDCIYTIYLDLANPYELFRSTDISVFVGLELIEGVQENNWPAQAEVWADESTNALNTAENLGVLGKIYEGLKLVKDIIELPKALKDMAQSLINLKGVSGASGVVSHLDDFKKVAEGIKSAESVSQSIGIGISDDDITIADNSGKLIDIAISLRDKTSPESSDVLGITDVTDLLFSGELANAQADYYWQEATVAATLSAYASNLDKLSAKQANGIMSRKDFSRYMMNLYAYSRSNELYYATRYAKNNAYAQTISGKVMIFLYCYSTNIDVADCYNSFQKKVVEAEKRDSENWGSAASRVKALAEKYNVRVE